MSNSLIILILLISITVALLLIFRTRVFGQDNVSYSLKENETGERKPKVDCVYGNLKYVLQGDTSVVVRHWQGSQYSEGAFCKGWHPAHPTFYVRKKCLDRYGAFDTSFAVSADFELMLRLIEKHRISNCYIDHCLVMMREGGESNGKLSNIIKGNWNIMRAFRKNGISVSMFYPVRRLLPKVIDRLRNTLHS